jgi:nicotinate-nucleotide pyrophosphorylase (carboxylating)
MTHEYATAIASTKAKVCETRKTAPGLRYLDKASVRVGGGVNHRYALYDAFLIKENHVAAAGGIAKAISACRESLWGKKRVRVMVEVRNWEEFHEALSAKPDRIMFDNMTPEDIQKCRLSIIETPERIELEATGGITIDNILSYAESGVDFISIGALTHSVKVMDLSLLLK